MSSIETLWKISVATPVVWRLTSMVVNAYDGSGQQGMGGASGLARFRPDEVLGSRVIDFLSWLAMWMSAKTAVWVACGFAGVLLNWLALSGIARIARKAKTTRVAERAMATTQTAEGSAGAPQLCR